MAVAAKLKSKKTEGKRKGAKRKRGKRRYVPSVTCDVVMQTRTPLTTEATGRMATALVAFREKLTAWKTQVKKHFADGGSESDMPAQPACPDINKGAVSMAAYGKLLDKLDAGESDVYDFPRYNPVQIELANLLGCSVIRKGTVKTQKNKPSNWDEELWGNWYIEDTEGEFSVPSRLYIDKKPPRKQHATSVEKLVVDPEKNILTLGNHRYVVGNNTLAGCAVMILRPIKDRKNGNFLAGDLARRRMSIAGNKDILDVVFHVEDKPNNGAGVTIKGNWTPDINEVVFMPGQALTPGFLFRGDKRLDAKTIRSLKDAKGLKFKAIPFGEPIIGKPIHESKLWAEIQVSGKASLSAMRKRDGRSDEWEKASPKESSLRNLGTTSRISPTTMTCFAFRSAECGIVPYRITHADGTFSDGVAIGSRGNSELNVSARQSRATEKPEKGVKKSKSTRDKAKSKVKVESKSKAKAKAKVESKAKVTKPADAAPPIEHDTADEKAEVVNS